MGIWGVDVSRWQHPDGVALGWARLRSAHPRMGFGFVKGSEGEDDGASNPYRAADIRAALRNDVAVGVYHYAAPNRPVVQDARAEARVAMAQAGPVRVGMLPLVLDLESNHAGLSPEEMAQWALAWLGAVDKQTGRTPILYTYPTFFEAEVVADPRFTRYPLWIAHYGRDLAAPTVPSPWTAWSFWQFSSQGRLPGSVADIDLNVFAGSGAELRLMAGILPRGAAAEGPISGAGVSLMGDALWGALTP